MRKPDLELVYKVVNTSNSTKEDQQKGINAAMCRRGLCTYLKVYCVVHL